MSKNYGDSRIFMAIPEAAEVRDAIRFAVGYIEHNSAGTDSDRTSVEELKAFAARLEGLMLAEEEAKRKGWGTYNEHSNSLYGKDEHSKLIARLKGFFRGIW